MKGYYTDEESGKGLAVPTGRLRINVDNLEEFNQLLNDAENEANKLRDTIHRLRNFELNIDFSTDDIKQDR